MSDLARLLDADPVVITAGVDVLATTLESQSAVVHRADWSPPFAGTGEALATLTATDVDAANQQALDQMLAARPHLVRVVRASDTLPDMDARTLLHAGPPVTWGEASGPLRGSGNRR